MRQVDEIVNLIVETVMCKNDKILIASNWYPASLVKKKFLMLTYSHIEYVLHCMSGNTTKVKNIKKYLLAALFNGVKLSHQAPTLYDVVPKEEIAEFEELMRKTIADIVSEASSVACWVYVQKYVKQKTLDEMLQELPGAGQFIIVMNTWFDRLMADQ